MALIYTVTDYRRWTKFRDANAMGPLMQQRLERWEELSKQLEGTGLRLREMKWDRGRGIAVGFYKEEQ